MMKHTSELKCSFVGIILKRMEIGFLKCDFNYIFIVLLNPNLIYSLLPGVGLGFVLEKSRSKFAGDQSKNTECFQGFEMEFDNDCS